MDAVKFLKEKRRMCELFVECQPCPIYVKRSEPEYESYSCDQFVNCYSGLAASIVEQWSKEHPIVTNKQKFEEVFGRTYMSLPSFVGEWLEQEYKEPKGEE